MRNLRAARLLTVLALVVPATATAWVVAGPASAVAPAHCAVLKSNVQGSGTVSKCTDPANTGGSGKIVTSLALKTGKVTWNKTGTTTFKFTFATVKKDEKETKV